MSDSGIRSLTRSVQTNIMPLQDVSQHVRDDIVYALSIETNTDAIKAVYHEPEGFYLISFPTNNQCFWFDIRKVRADGSAPCFYWNNIKPFSLLSSKDKTLYLGKIGLIGKYFGYMDNTSTYDMAYYTAWLSFGANYIDKILKRIKITVAGNVSASFNVRWSYDYSGQYFSEAQTITSNTISQYGIAEYNIAEYNSGIAINELSSPGSSIGKMIQVGFTSTVNGAYFAIQRFDVLVKKGRMR